MQSFYHQKIIKALSPAIIRKIANSLALASTGKHYPHSLQLNQEIHLSSGAGNVTVFAVYKERVTSFVTISGFTFYCW